MVSNVQRRRLDAFNQQQGGRYADHDLDVLAYLGIRSRQIAEHLLWEDRDAILDSFDELVSVAESDEGTAGASARYTRLRKWRDQHTDPAVRTVSDADLGRLATAKINSADDLGRTATLLQSGLHLIGHADELLRLLDVPARGSLEPDDDPGSEPAPPSRAADPEPEPEPEPQPEPEPEPEPEVPDPSKPFDWVQVARFKAFDWSAGNAEPTGHLVATTVDGMVQLEWTPPKEPAPVTLYRIVQSPDSWPTGAPEMASMVGITRATAGAAPLRPNGQVTYLAVWANQGNSVLEASQSQPVLIGSSEIVWPPSAFTVNATADKAVAASWRAPEGSKVEVQRFPKGIPVHYDQSRMLPPQSVSTGGFLDREPPLGEEIVYAAFCVAKLPSGSSAISAPVTAEITITPDAEPIKLDVKRSQAVQGAYDLTWMQPRNGRVELFATEERPPQGLENEPRTREIIESQGLTQDFRITYPANDLGGIKTIQGFVVNRSWVRAHFVAVHVVSDELVWVGPPVSMVTPRPPEWAEVIERVDAQVLSFPWPEGVSIVEAFQGPRGAEVDPVNNEPIAQLTRDDYDKTGGMRVTRALPSNGCSLHLFGVVYLEGQPVYSAATTIDYPGITRMRYEIVPMQAGQQEAAPGTTPAFYRIFAEVDDELHDTPIVLVGNPSRLPLHPGDGDMVQEAVVSLAAGEKIFVGDLPVGSRPLHVRLFINRPAAETGTIAVLDPRLDQLRMWV